MEIASNKIGADLTDARVRARARAHTHTHTHTHTHAHVRWHIPESSN